MRKGTRRTPAGEFARMQEMKGGWSVRMRLANCFGVESEISEIFPWGIIAVR